MEHTAVLDRALSLLEVIYYHIHVEMEAGPGTRTERVIVCAGEEPSSASSASSLRCWASCLPPGVLHTGPGECVWVK